MPWNSEIRERFDAILAGFDALAEKCDADTSEVMEDFNAELEDALILLAELRPGEADSAEDFVDTLEDIRALAGDYRRQFGDMPGVAQLAQRLEEAVETSVVDL